VVSLTSLDELTSSHHDADLLLTHFGYQERGPSRAFELLDRVRAWPQRPPVIVFASSQTTPDQLAANRRECLRRGAWEYTTQWGELYRAIELVLGRVPGQSAGY
jgi:CheY-like chemotaxis protein